MSRKNRDLSTLNHEIPAVGALVTVKVYAPGGAELVTKGFVLKKIPDRQTSLFSSVSIYLLANHTTEIVFANQIIEVLSSPA